MLQLVETTSGAPASRASCPSSARMFEYSHRSRASPRGSSTRLSQTAAPAVDSAPGGTAVDDAGQGWNRPRFRRQSLRPAAGILCGLLAASIPSRSPSQEIPRDRYLRYLPLSHARLVPQNDASARLHLYGDPALPAYRDVDPVDGVDDARHGALLDLATRFAPHLVQNTASIPVDFRRFIANRDTFALYVDTWEIGGNVPSLVHRDAVNLSLLGREACGGGGDTLAADADCQILELLSAFSPDGAPSAGNRVRTRPEHFRVLFVDFPGEGPATWKQVYEAEYLRTPLAERDAYPHAFVHPFIHAAADSAGRSLGYELIMQYWFFYPSNDGANNHEGDWEHMNVVVAPLDRVTEPLSAADIDAMLRSPWLGEAGQAPVIRRVEYYFHHFVMTLDYAQPNVYRPRQEWKAEIGRLTQQRLLESDIWKAIREVAYVDDEETQVNTHPIGYIGADNKGIDQVMVAPGGNNRDSHGTYPFSGRYHDIGAAGATEQVSAYLDPRDHLGAASRREGGVAPVFCRGRVLDLGVAGRLTIVPDWERVAALVQSDAGARREWSWLLLPILWGYPASESPLAGIVEFADTGNQAPVGPAFSGGWNASGAARGFQPYEPHTLPSLFPLGLQDSFRNDLGWANATYPVLLNLPPLDFASRVLAYPFRELLGRQDPVYYPKEGLPYRFFGLSAGISTQMLHEDFTTLAINPQQLDSFILSALLHFITSGADSTTRTTASDTPMDAAISSFFDMSFYVGKRFVSQNLVRNAGSRFGLDVQFNNIPPYSYAARIEMWEYAGSIRYNLATGSWQPFAKAGYGWTWTRVEDAQVNGAPLAPASSAWISPGLWPNTWHLGAGIEFAPWRRIGRFPRGPELSLRCEYAVYFQDLGLDLSSVELGELRLLFRTLGDVPGSETVRRHAAILGATLSF
jgi:hypothetical protein